MGTFEVWGVSQSLGKGVGQWRKIVWRGQVKEICPKCIILEVSGVIRVDSGMFWSECKITVCNYLVEPSIQNHNRVLDCVMSSEVLSWRRSGPPRSTRPPHDRVSRRSSVRASCRNQPSPQPHTSPPAVRAGFQSTPCSWASKTSSCSLQTF